MQSTLAAHYEQMTNYQKALKEKEKQEDAMRQERFMEDNRRAMEAEKEKKRAKLENQKLEQMDFLRKKEEENSKIAVGPNPDDFKRSNSSNIFKNRLKSLVSFKFEENYSIKMLRMKGIFSKANQYI